MKQYQVQKIHVCRFCKQSFSNGKKLGGHMRRHLALISAGRKKGTEENDQEVIKGEKDVAVLDDDHIIKKSQSIDQHDHDNGRKLGIREHDREVINGGNGLDEEDDELIKNSQQRLDMNECYDANGRKQGMQEVVNYEKGVDYDDVNEKKSQQTTDFDQGYEAKVYVLRENPKRSWRVINSHSLRKESIKNSVCDKCGKCFDSVKALHGHMRCHSIKRSRPLDEESAQSSSPKHEHEDDDDGVVNLARKKRSCKRYKSPKPNHFSTSLSSSNGDEVVEGATNLMMLSRGIGNLENS